MLMCFARRTAILFDGTLGGASLGPEAWAHA